MRSDFAMVAPETAAAPPELVSWQTADHVAAAPRPLASRLHWEPFHLPPPTDLVTTLQHLLI